MRGPFIAVPTCRCHQGGRHKLTFRRASGLRRLAAPRPGCGSNVSDLSSELVGVTGPGQEKFQNNRPAIRRDLSGTEECLQGFRYELPLPTGS